jgi:hypothetical protein
MKFYLFIFFIRLVNGQDYLHQHFFISVCLRICIYEFIFTVIITTLPPTCIFFFIGEHQTIIYFVIFHNQFFIFHYSSTSLYFKFCIREFILIKLVNSDTFVLFRVSLDPDTPVILGQADSFSKIELPATIIANSRPKQNKVEKLLWQLNKIEPALIFRKFFGKFNTREQRNRPTSHF